ncbi:MAG TPA: EF-hand domain-containing protein [Verrucomicrobiae bacterium]|jgi:hypothetical protein|nr:EF-hand domain-containing protein [Verrucomicrobiae bacterium]
MNAKRLIIFALALSLPASTLLAQDGPPSGGPDNPPPAGGPGQGGPGGRHHRPPPMPIIMALDVNHDGVISADEIANAPAALKTLDKNGDGQLTKDEYMPQRPNRNGGPDVPPPGDDNHKRPLPPIVAALDTNGDGIISADEIANAATSLLKLDKNGDGKLTMDELRPPRPQGGPDDGPDGDGHRPPPPAGQNNN